MIDDITIQRIKDAANVVDVIGDFYTLRRDGTGGKYKCLCPFHDDRHIGSFKVSEARNCYTCFACGAHGGPVDFLMEHEKMSFVEAIKWLGAKYGIAVEGAENYHPKPATPHAPAPELPMLELPKQMVKDLMKGQGDNTLVKWLYSLNWNDEQRESIHNILQLYLVGNGKEGHTVFWQVDEELNVRTAKMMLYKADGHRDKETAHNFDFVHSVLLRAGVWDDEKFDYKTCFFGQHLLDCFPDATINLVESEKTAILCAIAYGDLEKHLWIATGGLNFLTASRLKAFVDRKRYIVCYPDRDAVQAWSDKIKTLAYENIAITSNVRNLYTAEDGEKADIADVILRLMKQDKGDVLEQLCKQNPILNVLIDKLDLELV